MTNLWGAHKYCLQGTRKDKSAGEERTRLLALRLPGRLFLVFLESVFLSNFTFFFQVLTWNSKHETWSCGVSGSWNLLFRGLVCAAQICVCDFPWRCDQEHDRHTAGRCEYINLLVHGFYDMDIYFQPSTFEIVQMQLYYSIWTPFYAYIWLQEYLKRYGYIDVLQKSGLQAVVSPSKALKELQRQLGLEETGSLDQPTIDAMKQPRCGVPDIRNYQTFDGDLKWDHSEVTYRWEIICTKPLTTTFLSHMFVMNMM